MRGAINVSLVCPYCGAEKMCDHSYVDNSEPGPIGNEANIQFSKIPVRQIAPPEPTK